MKIKLGIKSLVCCHPKMTKHPHHNHSDHPQPRIIRYASAKCAVLHDLCSHHRLGVAGEIPGFLSPLLPFHHWLALQLQQPSLHGLLWRRRRIVCLNWFLGCCTHPARSTTPLSKLYPPCAIIISSFQRAHTAESFNHLVARGGRGGATTLEWVGVELFLKESPPVWGWWGSGTIRVAHSSVANRWWIGVIVVVSLCVHTDTHTYTLHIFAVVSWCAARLICYLCVEYK